MQRKIGWSGIVFGIMLSLVLAWGSVAQDVESIVFLHTNDEHGVIENYGLIAWKAAALKESYDHVFLVSGGDIFSGNPVVDEYVIDGENLRGYPMIDLMNLAGYDVLVIGNHEFDYGQEVLQDRMDQAEFPMILANIDAEDGYMEQPKPYVILETEAGTNVAFLGLVQITPAGIPSTHPGNLGGLEFFDPVETALEYVYLADESDIFVGLTHMGYSWDQELAGAMGELDIIMGGHSHTVAESPGFHNDVLVAQAGANTEYLGKVVVEFCTSEGTVLSREGRLLSIEDIEDTVSEVEERITYFEDQVEEIFARRINYMPEPLVGNMELGSFMTDAMTKMLQVDFAFQNNGGIRVNEMSGLVTVGCVFEIEPFGNDIVVFDMTPDDIRSLLRFSYERRNSVDLQTAGLHYEVEINLLGDVVHIGLYYPDGEPLEEEKVYEVALNSYVASAYEFQAQDEGFNTYRRHNDLIVDYLEAITPEHLAAYSGIDRIGVKVLPEGEGTTIGHSDVPISTIDKRQGSVSAGNIMADAVAKITGADIGTYPTSELNTGAEIPAGPVFKESLANVLYGSFGFGNNITVATVTGADVEKMIHGQNLWYGGPSTQVSRGVSYELLYEGDAIVATHVYIDGERIDADKEYTIGVNSYQYQFYSRGVDVLSSFTTDENEQTILIQYLEELDRVDDTAMESRIVIKE